LKIIQQPKEKRHPSAIQPHSIDALGIKEINGVESDIEIVKMPICKSVSK